MHRLTAAEVWLRQARRTALLAHRVVKQREANAAAMRAVAARLPAPRRSPEHPARTSTRPAPLTTVRAPTTRDV